MAEHPLSQAVQRVYSRLCEETNFLCRLNDSLTPEQVALFSMLHEDVKKRYYGSGIFVPEKLEGKRVLDLGCGSGSLVFMLSKLVGPSGFVVGVDLCDRLIQTAQDQTDYHTKLWGFEKPNFEFKKGNVERLLAEGFEPESFDIIVSNGVFCVVPDKDKAFRTAFSLLKEGGQFCLNDVYAEKDAPEQYRENETLWTLGITGAMRWDTLGPVVRDVGFTTPHLTCAAPVEIVNEEYKQLLENRRYACAGWRLFKLGSGPTRGASSVTYKGNIPGCPETFVWDVDLTFKTGEPVEVDGELATLLARSYLSDSFTFADANGSPVTKRNQNPFAYLDKLEELGQLPDPIYKVE